MRRSTDRTGVAALWLVACAIGIVGIHVMAGASTLAADWPQQMGPNRDGIVSGDGLAPEWKDGKLPVLWQTSAGFGTAPVVVEKGRVYTFGLFKPGTKPEDIPLAASTPTLEEVRAGSTVDGQPLSTRQLPDSPSWEEDHHPAYRCDEYAFCLDAATGKLLWASKLTDWGIAYQANTCWGSMTLHRGAVWFIRSRTENVGAAVRTIGRRGA